MNIIESEALPSIDRLCGWDLWVFKVVNGVRTRFRAIEGETIGVVASVREALISGRSDGEGGEIADAIRAGIRFPPEDPEFQHMTVFRRSVRVLTRSIHGVRFGYYYPFGQCWGVDGIDGEVLVVEWWPIPEAGTGTQVHS